MNTCTVRNLFLAIILGFVIAQFASSQIFSRNIPAAGFAIDCIIGLTVFWLMKGPWRLKIFASAVAYFSAFIILMSYFDIARAIKELHYFLPGVIGVGLGLISWYVIFRRSCVDNN